MLRALPWMNSSICKPCWHCCQAICRQRGLASDVRRRASRSLVRLLPGTATIWAFFRFERGPVPCCARCNGSERLANATSARSKPALLTKPASQPASAQRIDAHRAVTMNEVYAPTGVYPQAGELAQCGPASHASPSMCRSFDHTRTRGSACVGGIEAVFDVVLEHHLDVAWGVVCPGWNEGVVASGNTSTLRAYDRGAEGGLTTLHSALWSTRRFG
jgi:hypothetical protein